MPTYQVMPNLSEEEYQTLKADIAMQGVLVPVEVDEQGNILDGYHRVQACRELGLLDWPRMVRSGLTEAEKRSHARKLNALRRHLTAEQKRDLIRQQLRETPDKSDHLLAAWLGVTGKTVRAVREEMETTSEIPKLDRLVSADGRERPRLMERRLTPIFAARDPLAPSGPMGSHPPATLDVHFSSEGVEWYTPRHIIERVVAILGAIDLDPCSNSHTHPHVPAARQYTRPDDGLRQKWTGRVFFNPPYGQAIDRWIAKLYDEWDRGTVTAAVALLPARTDTAWFRRLRDFPVCFLQGRLRFSGHENSAPFPSAVFYLGPEPGRFVAAFGDIEDIYRRIDAGDGISNAA